MVRLFVVLSAGPEQITCPSREGQTASGCPRMPLGSSHHDEMLIVWRSGSRAVSGRPRSLQATPPIDFQLRFFQSLDFLMILPWFLSCLTRRSVPSGMSRYICLAIWPLACCSCGLDAIKYSFNNAPYQTARPQGRSQDTAWTAFTATHAAGMRETSGVNTHHSYRRQRVKVTAVVMF